MKSLDKDYQEIEIFQQQTRETINFKKDILLMKKRIIKTAKRILNRKINGISKYK